MFSNLSSSTVAVLMALVGLAVLVATALRDALTSKVPPAALTFPPRVRVLLATLAGVAVVALGALAPGGTWRVVALAVLAKLTITLPKLIFAEKSDDETAPAPSTVVVSTSPPKEGV